MSGQTLEIQPVEDSGHDSVCVVHAVKRNGLAAFAEVIPSENPVQKPAAPTPQKTRNPFVDSGDIPESRQIVVTEKEFVAAVAGKCGGDLFPRHGGKQKGRQGGVVAVGLVIQIRQFRQNLEQLFPGHDFAGVIRTQIVRNLPGIRAFVFAGRFKTDREGLQFASAELTLCNGADQGGVDPSGKERAQRNVRHQLLPDGLVQQAVQFIRGVLERAGKFRFGNLDPPVRFRAAFSVLENRIFARRDFAYVTVNAQRRRYVTQIEILVERGGIKLSVKSGARGDGFEFRGEKQFSVPDLIIERFDSHAVAEQEQTRRCGPAVPDRGGVHPAQSFEKRFAFEPESPEQDFRIGIGAELRSLFFESGAQFAVIVDFAVDRDGDSPVGRDERLFSRFGEVEDA